LSAIKKPREHFCLKKPNWTSSGITPEAWNHRLVPRPNKYVFLSHPVMFYFYRAALLYVY
jgi:hypothetical protein